MSVDKLVDSTQLDSDLTSVANAIRTKGGTSASLAFPADFVNAINAISGGGGYSIDDIATYGSGNGISGAITINIVGSELRRNAFTMCVNITSVSAPYLTMASNSNWRGASAFQACTGLTEIHFPVLEAVINSMFDGCQFTVGCFPALRNIESAGFKGCNKMTILEIGGEPTQNGKIDAWALQNCSLLTTIILRSTNIFPLGGTNGFGSTPFKNGGTGGTIYIPKSLYDHLGDGTSLDYKAASNWSTINGYGTITWAKIEGSYYETHYADGTLIPT